MTTEKRSPGKNPKWQEVSQMQPSGRYPTQYDHVIAFHILSDQPVFPLGMALPEAKWLERKIKLLQEEHTELVAELMKLKDKPSTYSVESLAAVMRECVDLVYVVMGTAALLGMPFDVAFQMVHKGNLDKVKDGVVWNGHKVVKPEGWEAPELEKLVQNVMLSNRAFMAEQERQQKEAEKEVKVLLPQ